MQLEKPSKDTRKGKISIAMAVFNGENYLEKQLLSLLNQSVLPDELIVCEDCSSDSSLNILQSFAEKAPFFVKIIQNEKNQGYVYTFSKALESTTGDLIFLCDQDDFWFENKIQEVVAFAQENSKFSLYLNDAELADGNLIAKGLTTFGQMRNAEIPVETLVLGCCMALRKELLEFCIPIPSNFSAHDVWIDEIAALSNSKIVIDKPLQYYRRHQKNESTHVLYSFKKISKWDYRFDYFKKLVWIRNISRLSSRLSDQQCLIKKIRELKEFFPLEYQSILDSKISRYSKEIMILKKRLELLNNSFFSRLKGSLQLLRKGYGGSFYGIGSFFKDILKVH